VIVFARIITEKFKMITNSEGHSKRNPLLCLCWPHGHHHPEDDDESAGNFQERILFTSTEIFEMTVTINYLCYR